MGEAKGSGKGGKKDMWSVLRGGLTLPSHPIYAQCTRPMVRQACTVHGQAAASSMHWKLAYGGCQFALSHYTHMVYTDRHQSVTTGCTTLKMRDSRV